MEKSVNIKNRKARYEYELIDKYTAGIQLMGTEIKSIRSSKADIAAAFCLFIKNELWVRNMHVAEYTHGNVNNHEPVRDRKLLLGKKELQKIRKKCDEKGLTLIPTRLFISNRGFAKLEIATAKGKKLHDKRDNIKQRDAKRSIDRALRS
jgi:SsrA-binding protein